MKMILISGILLFAVACGNKGTSTTSDGDTTTVNRQMNGDTTNRAGDISSGDREFAMKANMGNLAEIEAGTVAAQRGSSSGVKEYGNMMVTDHGSAQTTLRSIMNNLGIQAPDSLDDTHREANRKLSALKGAAFDKEYIAGQIKDHQETIAMFEQEANSGSNSQLREFAASTLPTLRKHLEHVQRLDKK